MMNELNIDKKVETHPIITVIGVGGGGGNALNYMWKLGIKDVNFLACNTDKKALDNLQIPNENKIVLGNPEDPFYGLGAGNNPDKGRDLATASTAVIRQYLESKGTKMVFIAAGMGGGTGTGAAPVIAKLAHEMGLLTVANVTSPMPSEGTLRCNQANEGIEELRKYADSLLVLNNDSIRQQFGHLNVVEAFNKADDVLASATKGIAEIITVESAFVRVDFADVDRVMRGSGRAHMGVAQAIGENRATEAARRSLCSPLLDSNSIMGSENILINISAKAVEDISYEEINVILDYIQDYASYKKEDGSVQLANIIWGISSKDILADDALEVVVVATGFSDIEGSGNVFPDNSDIIEFVTNGPDKKEDGPLSRPEDKKSSDIDIKDKREPKKETLEPRPQKFQNIDKDLKIPAFRRRNVGMMENNTTAGRKESFRIESSDDTAAANTNNNLFGE